MPSDNPYLDMVQQNQAAIAGAAVTPPDQAAEALRLAPEAGVPPATVAADPTTVKGMVGVRRAQTISNTDPNMARWAGSDPMHVAASQDQFPWLQKFGQVWDHLKTATWVPPSQREDQSFLGAAGRGIVGVPKEISEEFWQGYEQIKHGLASFGSPTTTQRLQQQAHTDPFGSWVQAQQTYGEPLMGAMQSAWSWLTGAMTSAVGRPVEEATGFRRQLTGNILSMLVPLGAKAVKVPEAATPVAAAAEENAALMDAVHQTVQAAPLQERSPTTMAEFVRQQTEGSPLSETRINPQTVVDAYDAAGHTPFPEDGILGWMPDLKEKLDAALKSGQDLTVPTPEYLTNVSEAGHQSLRGGLSFGEATSLDDAKNIEATIQNVTSELAEQKDFAEVGGEAPSAEVAAAVAKVKAEQYLSPLFKTAADAGMTEPQFALYSKQLEAADASLYAKAQALAAKQIERERGAEWKARGEAIAPEVRDALAQNPAVAARHFLATGEDIRGTGLSSVKLDRASIAEAHPDLVNDLPMTAFGKNGVDADTLAEAFGARSGEQLLRSIVDLERVRKESPGKPTIKGHLDEMFQNAVNSRLRNELGDYLRPGSLEEAVREATHEPPVQRLLNTQLQILGKYAGMPLEKFDTEMLAREAFEQMRAKDAASVRRIEGYVGRNGRDAEIALLKKDYAKAFSAKQKQLINNHILRLVHDFRKEMARNARDGKRWTASPTIKSISQEYLNYMHQELAKMGFRVKRDPLELATSTEGKSLEKFIDEKNAQGDEIIHAPVTPGVKLSNLSVSALRDNFDMLRSLATNGKRAQEIVTHAGAMEFADAVNRARDQFADRANVRSLGELVDNSKTYHGLRVRMRNAFQDIVAPARVTEFMVDDLDKGKGIYGVYNEVVNRPMQDAWNARSTEIRAFAQHLTKFTENAPKKWGKLLDTEIEVPLEFRDIHGDTINPIGTKKNLLQAALYYGSDSGRMKLLKGFGWEDAQEQALRAAFDKYLTPKDIEWLEHTWDYSKGLWPKIKEFTQKMSGVPAQEIQAVPFVVNGKKLSGGYVPIVYDRDLTPFAERQQPGGNSRDLFGPNYQRAITPRGYTKARTGYFGPLDLDPAHSYSNYLQVIHDLTTREAIASSQKFLTNQEVSAMIRKSLGNGYYKQLQPWLARIAGSMNTNLDELSGLGRLTNIGRHMIISSNLAYHIGTVWIHGTTAGAKSLQDLGIRGWNRAAQAFLDDPKGFIKFGVDNSEFLRDRKIDRDETLQEQYDRMTRNQSELDKFTKLAQDVGFKLLRMSDNVSAHVQWRGAYETAMADPNIGNHADAVYFADKAVRTAHGSGRDIDLPNLLGSKSPWVRTFTGFMTSRMNSLNRVWSSSNWKELFVHMMTTVGVSAAAYTAIHYKENEDLLEQLLVNGVAEGLGYIPLLGGVAYAVEHNDKVQSSLIDDMLQILVDNARDTGKISKGKHAPMVQDLMRASGAFTGGTSGALARPAQYWWDRSTGYRHSSGIGEDVSATLFGSKPKGH